jgi:hypothetical protein
MGNKSARPDTSDETRFQLKNGQYVNTNISSERIKEITATNGKTKLYMTQPGYIDASLNKNMQMNIGVAKNALEKLQSQYANNPDATKQITDVLTKLKDIDELKVNDAEKKRRVYRLAQIETKLAENERIKQTPGGVALEGAKTVASATGTVLGLLVNILFAAAQGSGNPGRAYAATQGPGAARIGGSKKRRMTKKRQIKRR